MTNVGGMIFKDCPKTPGVFIVSGLLSLVLLGCIRLGCNWLGSNAIKVEKEPETVTSHFSDNPPVIIGNPKRKGEGALTTWFYKCSNMLSYTISAESSPKGFVSASILVTGATIHIGLAVDVFLKSGSPKEVSDHENGHVKICQIIYSKADKIAYEAAKNVVGKTFYGNGSSHSQALENALQTAREAICVLYKVRTVELANKVSDTYDQISRHGQSKRSIEDVIAEALALNDAAPNNN